MKKSRSALTSRAASINYRTENQQIFNTCTAVWMGNGNINSSWAHITYPTNDQHSSLSVCYQSAETVPDFCQIYEWQKCDTWSLAGMSAVRRQLWAVMANGSTLMLQSQEMHGGQRELIDRFMAAAASCCWQSISNNVWWHSVGAPITPSRHHYNLISKLCNA